jgi:DNA replication protein DnaC
LGLRKLPVERGDRTLNRCLNPEHLIIDDFGLKQLPQNTGENSWEVIMRRYENRSTIKTSNRPLEEWGYLLGVVLIAGAILERFMQTCVQRQLFFTSSDN